MLSSCYTRDTVQVLYINNAMATILHRIFLFLVHLGGKMRYYGRYIVRHVSEVQSDS